VLFFQNILDIQFFMHGLLFFGQNKKIDVDCFEYFCVCISKVSEHRFLLFLLYFQEVQPVRVRSEVLYDYRMVLYCYVRQDKIKEESEPDPSFVSNLFTYQMLLLHLSAFF
jgi:hypothetical protein